jgi:hypothetical protein
VRIAAACAAFAAVAVVGCSSSLSSSALHLSGTGPSRSSGAAASTAASSSDSAAAESATAPAAPGPTAAPTPSASFSATVKTSAGGGNITIGPARGMVSGPMTITPLYCGKLSAAQRRQFGTTAVGGLIYQYANHLGMAAAAKLYVGFTDGTTLAAENDAATVASIASGQSGEGEVDAIGITGQGVSFTGCEVMSYALVTSSGADPVSYAG